MIQKSKVIVFDVDGTLCPIKETNESYADLTPYEEVVKKLKEYKAAGFTIVISSSRHMRTTDGNVGVIQAKYSSIMIEWLTKHEIPFDELYFGKPWPGEDGFYVDDRTVRPDEFTKLNYDEIKKLLSKK